MKTELRDALESIFPDSTVSKKPCVSMDLETALGGTGSVHVLLNDLEKEKGISFSVTLGGKDQKRIQWFQLIDVPVEINSGIIERTEKEWPGNPYVIRRAPFRVYDAMKPIGNSVKASEPVMAFRLHIPVNRNERSGVRDYKIRIRNGKDEQTLSLRLKISKAVIPAIGKDSFPYTNWFSMEIMAQRHKLEMWSDSHWRMIRKYADLMVRSRQNMFWVPLSYVFTMNANMPVLCKERLRKIIKLFTDAGMYYIEGGHVGGREKWTAPTFVLSGFPGLTGVRGTSAAGNQILACAAKQLMEEIRANGWRDRWLQHVADEPIKESVNDYRILAGMMRRHMPGIPLVDATMDIDLAGALDIWCPQAQDYQKDRIHFDAQKKIGDKVWFYTCLAPAGPWVNRLLDMELIRPALFGWGASLFDLDGFLHWGLNHYAANQNPFRQSVWPMTEGEKNLPAGDSHVVYPGTDGPWSSLRLEAQREGFEDYELLKGLKQHNQKKAERITKKVITGLDNYTTDLRKFRSTRKELYAAVEK